MTKHTPWHLVGVTSWATQGPIRPETVYIISDEAEPRKGKKALACAFNKEHAHLIAAAPDGLEANKLSLRNIESLLYKFAWKGDTSERQSLETWASIVRAAIAKAEGGAS